MSRSYEVMYIVKPIAQAAFEAVNAKISNLITNNKGTVEKLDIWGKKRLAYEVQDVTEGLYVLVSFSANPSCIKELDRVLRIDDNILRHMIISKGM